MKSINTYTYQSGQIVITLLIFMVVAITITTAAVILGISNSQATSKIEQGLVALQIAESGAENAILRLLRDPSYQNETLPVGDGSAVITVTTNGTQKIVESTGSLGGYRRTIRVIINSDNGTMTILSWEEIF